MCFEYIKNSWKCYSKNPVPFIIGALLIALVSGVGSSIASFILFGSPFAILSENISSLPEGQNLWIGASVFIITAFVAALLQLGMYGMAMESLRKRTGLRTMEKTFKYGWLNITIAGIISLFMALVASIPVFLVLMSGMDGMNLIAGMVLSITILLFVVMHLAMVFPAVVSKKTPIEAIKSSIASARSDYKSIILILLCFGIMSFAIGLIPFIGELISLILITPCNYIAICDFYQRAKKK